MYLHSLRLRKDIRTLFANHSVCNAATISTEAPSAKDLKGFEKPTEDSKNNQAAKKKAFLCKFSFSHIFIFSFVFRNI